MNMFQSIKDQLILCFDFFKAVPFAFLFVIFLLVFIFFIGFFVSLCVVKKSAKKERKDAINRSRAVLSGQMLEQVAPFLPDFPCNPGNHQAAPEHQHHLHVRHPRPDGGHDPGGPHRHHEGWLHPAGGHAPSGVSPPEKSVRGRVHRQPANEFSKRHADGKKRPICRIPTGKC
mgnify:CR=1 FL=1